MSPGTEVFTYCPSTGTHWPTGLVFLWACIRWIALSQAKGGFLG